MNRSENINELFTALSKAQGEITSENPFFKCEYANLAEIINVSKLPLSKNGLLIHQFPTYDVDKKTVTVETSLVHSSGQYLQTEITVLGDKIDIQTIGKLITYLRRSQIIDLFKKLTVGVK